MIKQDVELSPFQCILGAKVDSTRNKHTAKLVRILLYLARKTILKFWISKDSPSVRDWYREVLRLLPLEKLTYAVHDNTEGFLNVWQPVLDMVDTSGLDFFD